ncbi:DUF4232 domain-containing protein [Streptacidiphilus melanogenes]|uniref:DUF4232 domain-containing protein n=1 Tax=Streptacidiphilus melanogenes TaxID=411235 RepID=UPI0005A9A3FA|nr:DUF4232 domain-containing protein [Streptacidiphilus melanogenes]
MTLLSTTCLALTACQGAASADPTGAAPAASQSPTSTSAPTPQATPTDTGAPVATPTATRTGASTVPVDLVRCAPENLTAAPAQPQPSNAATSTYDEDVKLTNSGHSACELKGFPTVAVAGEGDPTHNRPLKVTPSGAAHAVRLAPGQSAWLKLSFRVVMGEADGYCASGATPTSAPSLVVGFGNGGIQVGPADGTFAECDDVVWASSFLTTHP